MHLMRSVCRFSASGLLFALIAVFIPATIAQSTSNSSPEAAPPGQPFIISPSGDIVTDQPTFTFTVETTSTWQQIEVTVEGAIVIDTWLEYAEYCSMGQCAYTPDASIATALEDNTASWRARSYDDSGTGPWSAVEAFTIKAPTFVSVTLPGDGTQPNYRIEQLTGPGGAITPYLYRLVVYNNTTGVLRLDTWLLPVTCGMDDQCVLFPYHDTSLTSGTYTAYVQAYTQNSGASAWAASDPFVVTANAPSLSNMRYGAVYEGFTTGGINCTPSCENRNVTLMVEYDLNDGDSGDWIELRVEADGDIVHTQWFPLDIWSFCNSGTCHFFVPHLFDWGQMVTWRFRTWDAIRGLSDWTIPGSGVSGDPFNRGVFTIE